MRRIAVTGYVGCDRVSKVFFVVDDADFAKQIAVWESSCGIVEWSVDLRK